MPSLGPLTDAITDGKREDARRLTEEAIEAAVPVQQILDALIAGMDEVGERFQCGEVFVPGMLVAARAMKETMALLEPMLVRAGLTPAFTTVIGTVQGDLHDIGKNLVAMMWKGANVGVVDLGTNVPPERFVAAAREHRVRVVGLSALLTTTMPAMELTVRAIRGAGLDDVKVVVGGAPISQAFAEQIGADGFAPDAPSAVALIRRLNGQEAR